jgi:hypothetical protein
MYIKGYLTKKKCLYLASTLSGNKIFYYLTFLCGDILKTIILNHKVPITDEVADDVNTGTINVKGPF